MLTKDLALSVHGKKMERKHYVTTQEWLDHVAKKMQARASFDRALLTGRRARSRPTRTSSEPTAPLELSTSSFLSRVFPLFHMSSSFLASSHVAKRLSRVARSSHHARKTYAGPN